MDEQDIQIGKDIYDSKKFRKLSKRTSKQSKKLARKQAKKDAAAARKYLESQWICWERNLRRLAQPRRSHARR